MPLDPQCEAVLKGMEAMGLPPIETMTIDEARATIATFQMMMGEPEEVPSAEDRTIPGPGGELPIRIYTPAAEGPRPVLVYFHGGGWSTGSIDVVDPVARMLANRSGCVVVTVGYRLAPEHPYPAGPDDAFAAVAWVAAHAAELGADPARLAVGGDSAGANLATVTCLRARDGGGPPIAFQLLVYPVVDRVGSHPSYQENDQYLLTPPLMQWFWGHYLAGGGSTDDPSVCPIQAKDLSGLPAAFILTAEFDPLRDEGEAYGARLADAGVAVDVRRYDGQIHGFFWMPAAVDRGRQAIDDAAAALRRAVG